MPGVVAFSLAHLIHEATPTIKANLATIGCYDVYSLHVLQQCKSVLILLCHSILYNGDMLQL